LVSEWQQQEVEEGLSETTPPVLWSWMAMLEAEANTAPAGELG
jgi:hypothetical protein